ncbi:MAG TPA: hypothetical protein VGL53_14260 [Bryobacteraceae bacterium]
MPLLLPVVLLCAQVAALVVSLRRGLWRTVPAWTAYLIVATIHVIIGVVLSMDIGRQYPMSMLYLEPAIILGQIAFSFESSVRFLGIEWKGRPLEGKLLIWLIPLVPAGIVLPIEFGFVRDALSSWSGHEGESLRLVYTVRLFLAVTLLFVLAAMMVAAKIGKRVTPRLALVHHRIIAAYLGCAVCGYFGKSYVSDTVDTAFTIVFFIIGPLLCFAIWSQAMWNASPADLEPARAGAGGNEDINLFESRRGVSAEYSHE